MDGRIDMRMGYRAEFKHGFVTMWFTELKTIYSVSIRCINTE